MNNLINKILYSSTFSLHNVFRDRATPYGAKGLVFNLKEKTANFIEKRAPFDKFIDPQPLPTINVEDLTEERFLKISENFQQPTVIRGAIRSSEAVKKWSMDYFMRKYGNYEFPAVENGDKHVKHSQMRIFKMAELLEATQEGKKPYINNLSRIFDDHPELIDDLGLAIVEKFYPDYRNRIVMMNLFLGGSKTYSSLHCTFSGNFFFQVVGRKRWVFISPIYSMYLNPVGAIPFVYAISLSDHSQTKDENNLISKLPRYETLLEPGDMLFNAPWWWHSVENITDFSVGCATRVGVLAPTLKNNLLLSINSQLFRYVLESIISDIKFKIQSKSKNPTDIEFSKGDKAIFKGMGFKERYGSKTGNFG